MCCRFSANRSGGIGGDDDYRGRDGEMAVEDYRTILPLTHRFVKAAVEAGVPFTPDLNGSQPEGVGYSQMSRHRRIRQSTARAFLRPARRRANLRVETEALARRILFDGRRATGVEYERGGTVMQARALREVIVCGGAVNSPQLLQISGIGPAAHLQSIGVPVVHDLSGRRLEPDRPSGGVARLSRARRDFGQRAAARRRGSCAKSRAGACSGPGR